MIEGKKSGMFVQQEKGGSYYEGSFINDLKHGHGLITQLDGEKYEG